MSETVRREASLRHMSAGLGALVLLLTVGPSTSWAELVGDPVTVVVSNSLGTATADLPLVSDLGEPAQTWGITAPVEVRSTNGQLLGTINALSVHVEYDPLISLSWNVTAGAADTTFSIESGVLSFAAVVAPDDAEATAGAIAHLLLDDELRLRMGQAAFRYAAENAIWETRLRAYDDVLHGLVSQDHT